MKTRNEIMNILESDLVSHQLRAVLSSAREIVAKTRLFRVEPTSRTAELDLPELRRLYESRLSSLIQKGIEIQGFQETVMQLKQISCKQVSMWVVVCDADELTLICDSDLALCGCYINARS